MQKELEIAKRETAALREQLRQQGSGIKLQVDVPETEPEPKPQPELEPQLQPQPQPQPQTHDSAGGIAAQAWLIDRGYTFSREQIDQLRGMVTQSGNAFNSKTLEGLELSGLDFAEVLGMEHAAKPENQAATGQPEPQPRTRVQPQPQTQADRRQFAWPAW